MPSATTSARAAPPRCCATRARPQRTASSLSAPHYAPSACFRRFIICFSLFYASLTRSRSRHFFFFIFACLFRSILRRLFFATLMPLLFHAITFFLSADRIAISRFRFSAILFSVISPVFIAAVFVAARSDFPFFLSFSLSSFFIFHAIAAFFCFR